MAVDLQVKAIEDIPEDAAFWREVEGMLAGAMLPMGARAARLGVESVGTAVVADMDAVHQTALDATRRATFEQISKITETTKEGLRQAMTAWQMTGVVTPEQRARGLPTLIRGLVDEDLFSPERARRIAVTETTRMFAIGNEAAAVDDPTVAGMRWQTAHDERVCAICGPRDGKVWPVGQGERPPAHVNCRCRVVEVTHRWLREHPTQWQGPPLTEDQQWAPFETPSISISAPTVMEERPSGIPISNALDTSKASVKVREILAILDDVHGDGPLERIPITMTSAYGRGGTYYYERRTGRADKITLSRRSETPGLSTLHEIGHFLDHQAIGKPGTWASSSADLAEWRDAVRATEAIKELGQLSHKKSLPITLPGGIKYNYPLDRKYIAYSQRTTEVFARSYAQYVATRSRNPALLEELKFRGEVRGQGQIDYPTQWTDADFKPVAAAFDNLMRKLGWRK